MKKLPAFTAVLCAFAALIIFPDAAAGGVKSGMDICIRSIIPSLFPFFTVTAFATEADLISGRRSSPPEMTLVEREVQRPFEGKKVLDNRADGRAMVEKSWLKLPGTGHYRVRARIAIHEISGTKNFKFGCMVSTKGAGTKWPAAFVGGAPFAEKELSFDFDFPEDASALLLVGFESGKGLAEFGDVTVSRVEEFCR